MPPVTAAGVRTRSTAVVIPRTFPGNVLRAEGSEVPAVADPSDPGLITTVTALHDEQASASVFILPSVLLVALVLLTAALAFRIRSARRCSARSFRSHRSVRRRRCVTLIRSGSG